ncbi:hypothetical protein TNCV_4286751 [Trichonephila clavipes]|nr:hypothetical protein TNCV_4286751 [Trichonephila clavipes]
MKLNRQNSGASELHVCISGDSQSDCQKLCCISTMRYLTPLVIMRLRRINAQMTIDRTIGLKEASWKIRGIASHRNYHGTGFLIINFPSCVQFESPQTTEKA